MKKIIAFCMVILVGLLILGIGNTAFGANHDISLTEPKLNPNVDLLTAFKLRQSTRQFLNKEVSMGDLSTILWAANGINRTDGKRTAPAAYGKYFIKVYVLSDQGVFCYEPEKNLLRFISDKQVKAKAGTQSDIKTASYVLLLTAKMNDFPFFVGPAEKIATANATAGCIGENVYLMASALKLGTRLVASMNVKGIRAGIALDKDEIPLYIMPLGYPKN